MNERTKRQIVRFSPLYKTAALFAGGVLLGAHVPGLEGTFLTRLCEVIIRALTPAADGFDPRVDNLVHHIFSLLSVTWGAAVVVSMISLVIGALYRMLARAKVHAGGRDPLQRARDLVAAHPRKTSAITVLPAVGWSAVIAKAATAIAVAGPWEAMLPQIVFPVGVAFVSIAYLARGGLRALLAPTLDRDAEEAAGELDAEGFTFDAVAVTKHTVGAVIAMMVFVLLPLMTVMSRTAMDFMRHTHSANAFLSAFVALALGGAFAFARKSRISIGLDGVLVGGTTKRRFVAYRDIDHAVARGATIELRSHDRAVLRLQLHGRDAGRRDAIVERFNAAIARANVHRADPAAAFVEGASVAELTRAAEGAASYRFAAPSREKLWEIFESPVLAAEARRAAAEALVPGIDAEERTRFRIAADQVAEPATRIRLQELIEADAEEEEASSSRRLQALESPAYR